MSTSQRIADVREARASILEAPNEQRAAVLTGRRRMAFPRRAIVPTLLLASVVLAVALRCQGLSLRSLWFDEAFSWRLSQSPLPETIDRSARDNHPPFYFLLLKIWCVTFGQSPVALRSLSVASGALAVVGAFLLLRDAWPTDSDVGARVEGDAPSPQVSPRGRGSSRASWAGLCGAALIAANVFQVRWGWETRMYALGAALALLSSWAMFRALAETRRPWRAWGLYALLGLAFAYTHVYALFSLAAQVVFLGFYVIARSRSATTAGKTAEDGCPASPDVRLSDRANRMVLSGAFKPRRLRSMPFARPMAAALMFMALGWLAWTPCVLRQRSQIKTDFWSVAVKAWDVPEVCYRLLAQPEDGSVSHTQAGWAAAFCAAVLSLLL